MSKIPRQHISRKQCLLGHVHLRVISTAHAPCGSHAFPHKFSSLSRRCMHSLENSWFRSNPLTGNLYSCSDMTAEYTEEFKCLDSQKSREFRSRERAVQLIGPPPTIHCSPKLWVRCCLVMQRVWFSALNKPERRALSLSLWWRGTYSKSTDIHPAKDYVLLQLLVCWLMLLVLRVDHSRCPPRHWPALISAGIDFWTCVGGNFLVFASLSEYCTPLKCCIVASCFCVYIFCSHIHCRITCNSYYNF